MFRATSGAGRADGPVFGVEFATRAGQPIPVQTDLEFRPRRWKATASGGYSECEIGVTGTRAGLKALRDWLNYDVQVFTLAGSQAWRGFVHEVVIQMDGWAVTVSLEGLRNRVAITYSSLEGAVESAQTTAWAEDAASQAEYGIREQFESIGQATTSMATAYRNRLLSDNAAPAYKRAFAQDGSARATLKCRGWFTALGYRYYQRTDGRLEHMPAGSETQPVGWGITNDTTNIAFGEAAVHDLLARLNHLQEGMRVAVTGSLNNNTTLTVRSSGDDAAVVYSANTIYFRLTDDILDSAAGMSAIGSNRWLYVTGSGLNSGWHFVEGAGAAGLNVEASAAGGGQIEIEDAGPAITLTQATRMDTFGITPLEMPGAAGGAGVTLTLHGHQLAQRFQPPVTMRIDRVMVEAAKVGAPGDNLEVRILADSAGSPGALIISGSIAPASLTEDLAAVWVPMSGTVTLAGGTNYWFQVRRAGAVNGANHYLVGMTPTAYSTCLAWTGSAWITHPQGWYLRFRLWAVEDTGTIMETMLASKIQYLTLAGGFASGVNGYPTMDQLATVADELARLLKIGTFAGARVLADVTGDRVLRLVSQAAATPGETLRLFTAGGVQRLTDAAGSPWPPGLLPAGMWVELADLDSDLAGEGGLSPAFIEAAQYDAETGAWDIEFEGERTLLDLLKVQAG